MRAGGCAVQQALTPDAAAVVKQAVTLARRRGHAQVTPLHVANTMLSASAGLLRTACLQSRSHPLQCRALELCFNVALNRLPASSSSSAAGPMMGSHHQHQQQHQNQPGISNALVAAFKRAQAHQRRGSVENQQQPLLAVKIELEQLIVSILDDPSVSRVMREAGFSSTQVKINVEQAVSLETCNSNNNNDDDSITFVIENMKKTKTFVVIGETISHVEEIIGGVMEKIEKDENTRRVSLTLASFAHLTRDEVERKVEELERLVKSYMTNSGVVLFLGDLKWISEYRSSTGSTDRRIDHYCPIEHMVIEIGKLVTQIGEKNRFSLIGIATFQTYKICKSGHFSLESVWGLNPVTIPSGSLRLGLAPDSDEQRQYTSKKCGWLQVALGSQNDDVEEENCCGECSAKLESEARRLRSGDDKSSTLPAWLQQYKDQNKPPTTTLHQDSVTIKDLGKKWSSICKSIHKHHHHLQQQHSSSKTLNFSSIITSPSSSNPYPSLHRNMSWPQHNTHFSTTPDPITLSPNSASSSDVIMELDHVSFKHLTAALEKTVPYHAHLSPDIAAAILRCRSGTVKRKEILHGSGLKEDTWLVFKGDDVAAKEAVARELARVVFGSHASYVSIGGSSDRDRGNKRSRDDRRRGCMERFADAVAEDPRRVFFIDDVDEFDWCSRMGFKRAVENGEVAGSSLGDGIFILCCESLGNSRSRACSPRSNTSSDREKSPCLSLDLNMSIDNVDGTEEYCLDLSVDGDIGLLGVVDAVVIFKFQDS